MTTTETMKENKMGVMPVKKLIVKWCFLIAESVAMVLSTFFFRKVYRKKVAPL